MLELYEQNRVPPSQAGEPEGSGGGGQRPHLKGPANEDHAAGSSHGAVPLKASSLKPTPLKPAPDQQRTDNHCGPPRSTQSRNNDYGSGADTIKHEVDDGMNISLHHDREVAPHHVNSGDFQNKAKFGIDEHDRDERLGNSVKIEPRDGEPKDHGRNMSYKDGTIGQSPQNASKKLDKEKLKAAFERRKARGDLSRKTDSMDELERQLEEVEVPGETEKIKREKKQNWPKPLNGPEHENSRHMKYSKEDGDGHYQAMKGHSSHTAGDDFEAVEEGEVEPSDEVDRGYQSPKSNPRKRKSGSPIDRNGPGRLSHSERDHKRFLQENHV